MIKKDRLQNRIKAVICAGALLLTGCSSIGLAQESTFESAYENNYEEEEPVDIYTSQATAVIEKVDTQAQTISVYLVDRNENRSFAYTGATLVNDRYGAGMSMAQLNPGDIADLKYNSELEQVGAILLTQDSWSYQDVTKYTLDAGNGSAFVGEESYSISDKVKVFSEGKEIDLNQIIQKDVLTIKGRGHTIMSIVVDKGHGYLKLVNDDAVAGGWIEVGQTIISQIAPDMLLTVPEGDYKIRITAAGIDESRDVTISRNKEVILNLGDIEIPEPENGIVTLKVTPESAQVSIDEIAVDTAYPIRLSMGLHQITAKADGYDTVSQYFEVKEEKTTVTLTLGELKSVSGNGTSSYYETDKGTVTIETPTDTEVYQDNLYMGIAPVTYNKTVGSHVITLRREGYVTKSYTIDVPDDSRDLTYAFPELEPDNTVSGNSAGGSSTSTVSGNTVNGSTGSTNGTVSGNTVSENSLGDKD